MKIALFIVLLVTLIFGGSLFIVGPDKIMFSFIGFGCGVAGLLIIGTIYKRELS